MHSAGCQSMNRLESLIAASSAALAKDIESTGLGAGDTAQSQKLPALRSLINIAHPEVHVPPTSIGVPDSDRGADSSYPAKSPTSSDPFPTQGAAETPAESTSRPLPCPAPGCKRSFDRPSALQQHHRTHTGERPFPCELCTRAFATKGTLKAHVRIHTNERPFVCPHPGCGMAFRQSTHLTRHKRTRHQKKPVHESARTESALYGGLPRNAVGDSKPRDPPFDGRLRLYGDWPGSGTQSSSYSAAVQLYSRLLENRSDLAYTPSAIRSVYNATNGPEKPQHTLKEHNPQAQPVAVGTWAPHSGAFIAQPYRPSEGGRTPALVDRLTYQLPQPPDFDRRFTDIIGRQLASLVARNTPAHGERRAHGAIQTTPTQSCPQ